MLALAAALIALAAAAPAEARTAGFPHAHKPRTHTHAPRPHKVRVPKSTFRTVRVRRADGTMMTGYRDSTGTHLMGPNGRTVHCQRQTGVADIDVACR
jgi:hypothetical protein